MIGCNCPKDKNGSFLDGLLLGAIVGGIAGVLLAPKSGEETRKDIQKLATDSRDYAIANYNLAKATIDRKMLDIRRIGERLDKTRYESLIAEVVGELRNNGQITPASAEKLGMQLRNDWEMVKLQITK